MAACTSILYLLVFPRIVTSIRGDTSGPGVIGERVSNAEELVVNRERGVCESRQRAESPDAGSFVSEGFLKGPADTAVKIKDCARLLPLVDLEKVIHRCGLVGIDEEGLLWYVSRIHNHNKCSGCELSLAEVQELESESVHVGDVIAFADPREVPAECVFLGITRLKLGTNHAELRIAHLSSVIPSHMGQEATSLRARTCRVP
jgi:acyl-CoA synthetase (AMP-forming)/AMP-acid ligase II